MSRLCMWVSFSLHLFQTQQRAVTDPMICSAIYKYKQLEGKKVRNRRNKQCYLILVAFIYCLFNNYYLPQAFNLAVITEQVLQATKHFS